MAEGDTAAGEDDPTSSSSAASPKKKGGVAAKSKQRRTGVVTRMWRGIFGGSDDYEKRLSYLSKEEASVHARMKRRALRARRTSRNLIFLSIVLEVLVLFLAVVCSSGVLPSVP